ncbi:hypothetical protein O181_091525, partial [Austropuccinia psidii MF-1]|nr:hypothetical protein [Austropuccinia psidii MF-1]
APILFLFLFLNLIQIIKFGIHSLFRRNLRLSFDLQIFHQTRSQARTQAVLTPTPTAPLDGTPAVSQLRAKLDRGPILEGEAPSRKEGGGPRRASSFSGVVGGFPGTSRTIFRGPGQDGEEEEENYVEEEESDGTEGVASLVGESQGTERPILAQSNQPVSNQCEPSLLVIMQQMTQIMAKF